MQFDEFVFCYKDIRRKAFFTIATLLMPLLENEFLRQNIILNEFFRQNLISSSFSCQNIISNEFSRQNIISS